MAWRCEAPAISLECTVLDPITREPYTRDPRYVAIKAEEHFSFSVEGSLSRKF
jgi:glutamine synthetase